MLTRTTQSGFASMMTYNIQKLSSRLQEVTEQAGTGVRLNSPSDAPGDQALLIRLRESLGDQEVWQSNADQGLAVMSVIDSSLSEANTTMDMALELAVQMASETYSDADRVAAAAEATALRDQLLSLGNTEVAGRYVFAGRDYGSPAFADDGSYQGSTELARIRVGEDRYEEVGMDGSEVFGAALAALDDLTAALEAGDADAVQSLTDDIQRALDGVSMQRQLAGYQFNRFDDARTLAENMGTAVLTRLDEFAGIDEAEVYTRLAELQTAYEAAMQVTSSGLSVTMFDFI